MEGFSINFEKSAHTARNSGNFSTHNSQYMTNKCICASQKPIENKKRAAALREKTPPIKSF